MSEKAIKDIPKLREQLDERLASQIKAMHKTQRGARSVAQREQLLARFKEHRDAATASRTEWLRRFDRSIRQNQDAIARLEHEIAAARKPAAHQPVAPKSQKTSTKSKKRTR